MFICGYVDKSEAQELLKLSNMKAELLFNEELFAMNIINFLNTDKFLWSQQDNYYFINTINSQLKTG